MSANIYLIAGEPSGDVLGGRLMQALKNFEPNVRFCGVGGPAMADEGLSSFVPMESLCVMGISEIVKEYPRLRKLAYAIIKNIETTHPDILVTIDLPDFNFAIAKKLKQRGIFKGKIIHYVAPSVWAWRPGRARKIAQFLDGLLCLFPFEPPYFETHGLRSKFIGHAMVESDILSGDGAAFRNRYNIEAETETLGVFFGSRMREIDTHAEVFLEAIETLKHTHLIVATLPKFETYLHDMFKRKNLSYTMMSDTTQKWNAFAAMDKALAVSGTVGLELAYAGIPHVIAYKTSPLTAFIARRLIKTDYVHLANILLQKQAIPEVLQENCTARKISQTLTHLNDQTMDLKRVRQLLKTDQNPSDKAAEFIFQTMAKQ